jgi:tagatose-1,6-bisphosphate aldolase
MSFSLDQIADDAGKFAILAMDQRGTLRRMLDKAGRPSADEDLSAFKVDVISALSPPASGVLTDVEYGVGPVRAAGAPDRGPAFVSGNGGVALKFLVRWRPDRPVVSGEPDLAQEALDAVSAVIADCREHGIPSVIEPLVTHLPTEDPFSAEQQKKMVIRSAELLAELGPDLLKLEWPGDEDGCLDTSKVCGNVPWALLSAGVKYDQFVERVLTAMDAGACGYIAGRAFWGEAVTLLGEERRDFLQTTALERMTALNAAIDGHGPSWREIGGR